MKALRSFPVRASLPEGIQGLLDIAANLRWTWDGRAIDLFRWVDSDAWEQSGHDPMQMLGLVSPDRFHELAEDGPFLSFLDSLGEDLNRYLTEPRWYQSQHRSGQGAPAPRGSIKGIAYFSPEFGVTEALPVYSGGLGVLAGDHLKAASDLGLPLVGIGLFYRQGYFRQALGADGWQRELYPALDPHAMPLTLHTGDGGAPTKIEVDLAGRPCVAQVWIARVGRVPLYLLDSDVEENEPSEREVTDRLYAGGSEHRLRQEILLGVGGVRALRAIGREPVRGAGSAGPQEKIAAGSAGPQEKIGAGSAGPQEKSGAGSAGPQGKIGAGYDVFHSNEGHAGFLGLERIRELVNREQLSWWEAIEAVRASTVFTTHTPVPAGIDRYDIDLLKPYFETFSKECGATLDDLMELGREPGDSEGRVFNMAVMGFRLAGRANGVSKLHGSVSREMFSDVWPNLPVEEVPISSVTNGVHTPTWLGSEMAEVFNRRLEPGWAENGHARWDRIKEVPDAELWRARERARERLVYFVRERLHGQATNRGASDSDSAWTEEVFDPGALTIGFARRFAQYKRATLILADADRLKRLLNSEDRPVQIVIAGKAHPRDDGGKEFIRRLVHFSSDPALRKRIAFIEDYDMEVARWLTRGVDVWLNNPRRPLEACGTSGMKAALNGALNLSVLDGWWDECYDGGNGWSIGTRQVHPDDDYQDRLESEALYDLLERDVTMRFYDRPEGPVPRRWVERIKGSISSLGKFVTADRMVRDYTLHHYEPAAELGAKLARGGYSEAKELARWKARLREEWPNVEVIEVDGDTSAAGVGDLRSVSARLRIGRLESGDVSVQLVHGRVGANGELISPEVLTMKPVEVADGEVTYGRQFEARAAGLYGFAVRVVPDHPSLTNPMDVGLMTWA